MIKKVANTRSPRDGRVHGVGAGTLTRRGIGAWLVGLAILVAGHPKPGQTSDWPQARGNPSFSAFAPVEIGGSLLFSWSVTASFAGKPVVVGRKIYLTSPDDDVLVARSVGDGGTLWETSIGGDLKTGQPAVGDGKVFVASFAQDYGYQAYDQYDGTLVWTSPDNYLTLAYLAPTQEVFCPAPGYVSYLGDDLIDPWDPAWESSYVAIMNTADGTLDSSNYFYHWTTPEVSWPWVHNARPVLAGLYYFQYAGPYDPVGVEGLALEFRGKRLYESGWGNASLSYELPQCGGGVMGLPGFVVTLSPDGMVLSAIAPWGDLVWPREFADPVWTSSSVGPLTKNSLASDGYRIVALSDNQITTISAATGTVFETTGLTGQPSTGPTLTLGAILYGDRLGNVHVLDSDTLEEREVVPVANAPIIGDVVVTGNGVYVAAADGTLARYAPSGCTARSLGYPQNGHQALGPGGVNTLSGNMTFTVQDVSIPFAGLSVNLLRTYNSQQAEPSGLFSPSGTVGPGGAFCSGTPYRSSLGLGWTHSYQVAMRPQFDSASGATLYVEERGDGRQPGFTHSVTGTGNPPGIVETFALLEQQSGVSSTWFGTGVQVTKKHGLVRDFDPDGNLLRIKDPAGNRLEFSYASGTPFTPPIRESRLRMIMYVSATTLAEGEIIPVCTTATVFLDYDGRGRLERVRYPHPDGLQMIETAYQFDGAEDLLVAVQGPGGAKGYASQYTYDSGNRMTGKYEPRAPAGEKRLRFVYDLEGRVEEVQTASSVAIARYRYAGTFATIQDLEGEVARRHETTITEYGNGVTVETTHVYSDCNVLREVHDALGGVTRYRWTADLNQYQLTDARGNTTTWFYDDRSNVVRVADPIGGTVYYEYEDSFNQITRKVDANGNVSRFSYDGTGNMTSTDQVVRELPKIGESATAYTTRHTYDPRGLRLSTRAANGATGYYHYDGVGNLTGTDEILVLPAGSSTTYTTRYEYDSLGRRTARVDPSGVRTEYDYDLENRLTEIGYGAGTSASTFTVYEYDPLNRLIKETDAAGRFTEYTYNDLDLVASITDAEGKAKGYATAHQYDLIGNRIWTVDPNGNKTEFTYDALNRLVEVKDAEDGGTSARYDAVGNLVEVTDPKKQVTSYEYDALNRLTAVHHSDGTDESFQYDAVGNRTGRIDGNGVNAEYLYDGLNQLRRIEYEDGTPEVFFRYDAVGNRVEAKTLVDGIDYTAESFYDSLDRLTRENIGAGGTGLASKVFTYDSVGNRLSMDVDAIATPGNDHRIEYTYDPLNRLATVVHNGRTATYFYDSSSNLIEMAYPNFVKTSYTYDLANRLTNLRNARQPSGIALSYFAYTYDNMNNRVSMRDIMGLHSYTYDKLYRLTGVDAPAYAQGYTYDPAGNRLSLTMASKARMLGTGLREYSYLSGNRLEKVQHGSDLAEYAWDNNGNVVSKDVSVGGGPVVQTSYTFDAANRMRAVQLPSGTSLAYSYDPDGKRVKQSIDGEVTWFVFDGLSVVMELGADRKPTSVLVPGVCKVRMDLHEPLTEYYLYDGLGSVVQMTDVRGNLTQEYRYDPFGGQINNLKDPFNRYRFAGLAHEDLTGLTYMNARWYEPGVGRFVGRDPNSGMVAAPQTLSLYLYAEGNPVSKTDVTGSEAVAGGVLVIGGLVGWETLKAAAVYAGGAAIAAAGGYKAGKLLRKWWSAKDVEQLKTTYMKGKDPSEEDNGKERPPESQQAEPTKGEPGKAGAKAPGQGKGGPENPPPIPRDPSQPPGKDWRWRSKDASATPGSRDGAYEGPGNRHLHRDVDHHGRSHWDYRDQDGNWWHWWDDTGEWEPK